MRTVATAGHVDHGKSSLVLALTGTDPDRFPEEKARGLTIDLGFAFTTLPSGARVGFVDVPGHVRFVKNMLAGVSAIEVALVVVAANEGWMPQTEEHVEILALLGVELGVVALTKADLIGSEMLDGVRRDLDDRLARHGLGHLPVVATDSVTGRGLDALRAALDDVLSSAPEPRDVGRPRLWIDRVFTARGAGTVVTGTLTGGEIALHDELVVTPGGRQTRVRGLEIDGDRLERVAPGTRVAINLAGVEHHDLERGSAIVRAAQWSTPKTFDVALTSTAGGLLRARATLHAHIGSGDHLARIRVLDPEGRSRACSSRRSSRWRPGIGSCSATLDRAERPRGARCSKSRRVGARATRRVELALPLLPRLLQGSPWLPVEGLERLTGLPVDQAEALAERAGARRLGRWLVAQENVDALLHAVAACVDEHVRAEPLDAGPDLVSLAGLLAVEPAQLRAALATAPGFRIDRGRVTRRGDARAARDAPGARALLDLLDTTPFAPPSPASVGAEPALVRALVREGTLVELGGIVFTAAALALARALIAEASREREAITVGDARDALGSSRRFVVPILERLDREGLTRRRGDRRIAGPAAERPV